MMTSLSPNSFWVARMTAGWICRPSQISSTVAPLSQGRADDPGLPVEEGGHGVEEVGGVAGPRTIGRHGGLIAGSGVAEGDGAGLGDLPDKGDGPLLLRRHGDQADHAGRWPH